MTGLFRHWTVHGYLMFSFFSKALDMTGILIIFIPCLLAIICASLLFIYRLLISQESTNGISEYDYVWERVLEAFFNIIQVGFSIASVTAILISLATHHTVHWMKLVMLYSLQLQAGTNARNLKPEIGAGQLNSIASLYPTLFFVFQLVNPFNLRHVYVGNVCDICRLLSCQVGLISTFT